MRNILHIAPRTVIKNILLLKEEKICYKMAYYHFLFRLSLSLEIAIYK